MAEQHKDRNQDRQGGGSRIALYGLAGIGLLTVAGAGYFLYREKSVEKANHTVSETDGDFEVRDYPELLVAEVTVEGERAYALDQGFGRLADFIFARHRDGERVAMTAPVLSSAGGGNSWVTRFVMPAHLTRDNLPAAGDGIRIQSLPARRVAAIRFAGHADEAVFAEREAQLRSWIGAKKFSPTGDIERAFYNSPFIPGPVRRTELLIPIA